MMFSQEVPKGISIGLLFEMQNSKSGNDLQKIITSHPWYKAWETGSFTGNKTGTHIRVHLLLSDSVVCHNVERYESDVKVDEKVNSYDIVFKDLIKQIKSNPVKK